MLDNILKCLMIAAAFSVGTMASLIGGLWSRPSFPAAYVTLCGVLLLMGAVRVTSYVVRDDDEFTRLWIVALVAVVAVALVIAYLIAGEVFKFKGF
jgi:uncharacterized membrane protein